MRELKITSFTLSWILITSLTLTPVMAQDLASPQPIKVVFVNDDEAIQRARQRLLKEPIAPEEVGTSVLYVLPPKAGAEAFPDGTRTTTAETGQTTSPGKASVAVVVVAITGAAAIATLLYFLFKGKKTILQAGAPRVNTP